MKYYKLAKDLPTFRKGQIFYINEFGFLVSKGEDPVVAYAASTLAKFPNILKDWFKEVPAPERDSETKHAFIEYLSDHKDERFFQAVRNFTRMHLNLKGTDTDGSFILASNLPPTAFEDDTFHWECDDMLKEEDGEEQRADEY